MKSPAIEQERRTEAFPGGGEMGDLVRRKDWAATPFGPIESWPQSLKTVTAAMLESSFAMVVAWGPDFRFLYNDRYRPIIGNKHPGALGAAASDIFPEVWSDLIEPLFLRARRGEAVAIDDLYIPLHRHGYLESCYFTIAYSPIRDESGHVGGLLAVVAETTERVEAERRLRTLRDLARRATEAKSPEQACAHAAEILRENPIDVPFGLLYLLEESGRFARRVAAAGIAAEHPAAPESIALDAASPWPLAEVARSGKPAVQRDVAGRFAGLGSGPYPEPVAEAVVMPLARPGAAQPHGFFVAGASARLALGDRYRDFLELAAEHITTAIANARAFEEERRRADALAEIDRAKTAFFSNVSHEFRTPLTLMLGPIEDVLKRPDDTPLAHLRAQLDLTQRNSLRLLKLVNTLLDFSRLEAGRLSAHYEPVDLGAFTSELAGVFRAAVEKAGLRLRVESPPLAEPAFVDRDMWEKIVFNLLSNALKFTLAGEIALDLRQRGRCFELSVRDTGVGIPERELPNLFKRFHRIENVRSRTHEGSGIGLALVQELVKLHGGSVTVASRVNEGSTFTVTIPAGSAHLPDERVDMVPDETGPYTIRPASSMTRIKPASFLQEALRWLPESRPAATLELPPIPAGRGASFSLPAAPRIVLADDNADMRDYVRRLLEATYQVETVADGAAALESIRREPPDLVLADVMMPRLDGFGLLCAIRDDPVLRGLPVILVSARAGNEASAEGYDAGADDYLIKPFTARELLARVASHLKMARLRQDVARQIQAAETRHERLLELMPTGVCTCDGMDRVQFHNRRLAEILGSAPRLGEVWREFVSRLSVLEPATGAVGCAASAFALGARREAATREVELVRPDGTRVIVEMTVNPIREGNGLEGGAILVLQDITERRRTERHAAVLARLAQEVALLADDREIIACTVRLVGEHLRVQRCYFSEIEAGGTRVRVAHDWRRSADVRTVEGTFELESFGPPEWRRALSQGTVAIEDAHVHPITRSFTASYDALAVRSYATAPFIRAGHWVVVLAVTDDRPRAWTRDEQALLENAVARVWPIVERVRAAAELRASEERFRLLADSMAALAWTADRLGWATWYNQRWHDFTGLSFEEMQGRGWERVHHPDHIARVVEKLDACALSGEPWEDTFPLRRKDGEYRWFLSRAVPLRDAQGNVVRWFGTNTDITELREAQEKLRQRTAALEVLNRVAAVLSEERDLERIERSVAEAGREISGAACGAFCYSVDDERGETTLRCASAGEPPEAFEGFAMPGGVEALGNAFRAGIVRLGDVRENPRCAGKEPLPGMPTAHRQVVSYLAVPVKSRSGEVLGGLIYGHPAADVFTPEAEAAVAALAAQAAVAIDNARLYRAAQHELAEQKRAEEALRESEARFQAVLDNSTTVIFVKARDGRYLFINDRYEKLFHVTKARMIGKTDFDVFAPELAGKFRANDEAVIAAGAPREFEEVAPHDDGPHTYISIKFPLRDARGEIHAVAGIATDITERKRGEQQLRRLYDLVASVNRADALEQIYGAALETIVHGQNASRAAILLFDANDVMRFVAWRGLSDAYRAVAEGHSPWRADERDARPVWIEDVEQAELAPPLRAAIAREGIRALAFIPLVSDARLIGKFMLYHDAPHAFTANELRGAEAIATQVAFAIERRRSAQALEALVAERTASLRQAIAQMEEFSYSVSHDLRSPVRAMRGYAAALLDDYGDRLDEQGREILARIQRNGLRMDRLIQDLLTYSRISRQEMRMEAVPLERLVRDVILQYPELHDDRVDLDLATPLPEVIAHEPSLAQAVSNLLTNAAKFVAPGVRPRLRIRAEERGDRVRLFIVDNGIGIPVAQQRRLFGMFERVHPELPYEGTGIGLAIVRKAMERMHGAVGVESDGVNGSEFWIELPRCSPP